MGKTATRKPSLKKFKEVCDAAKGNITKIAAAFGVYRATVYNWAADDPDFDSAIQEYRGRLLDECLNVARLTALGIPDIDPETKKITGWKERPDGNMIRYLISHLGQKEGFGDNLDITSNGETIKTEPTIVEIIDRREQVRVQEDDDEPDAEE